MNRRTLVATMVISLVVWSAACTKDPYEALAEHLQELTDILNQNMDDPDKAIEEIKEYLEVYGDEIRKLKAKTEELENNMSDREREAYNAKVEKEYGEVFESYTDAQSEFRERHPKKSEELRRLLKDVW